MYCLIRSTRCVVSIRQGFSKLLLGSSKQKTTTSSWWTVRNCHAYTFVNEKKFLRKDKLTPDYELIYKLKYPKMWIFIACSAYLLLIVAPVVFVYPYIFPNRQYYESVDAEEILEELSANIFIFKRNESILYGIVVITVNVSAFILSKRYPLRIYCNGERYVAIYINGFLPLLTKHHHFKKAYKLKSWTNMIPGMKLRLGNRRARLYFESFRRHYDCINMLDSPCYEEEEEEF